MPRYEDEQDPYTRPVHLAIRSRTQHGSSETIRGDAPIRSLVVID